MCQCQSVRRAERAFPFLIVLRLLAMGWAMEPEWLYGHELAVVGFVLLSGLFAVVVSIGGVLMWMRYDQLEHEADEVAAHQRRRLMASVSGHTANVTRLDTRHLIVGAGIAADPISSVPLVVVPWRHAPAVAVATGEAAAAHSRRKRRDRNLRMRYCVAGSIVLVLVLGIVAGIYFISQENTTATGAHGFQWTER